ncbi:hypothetical protein SEPCBS57363_005665 [Sporothrix epigloea]|uniref:Uncharacterized protein n=1 Tax=Sporothrix epigloea TaxID=1892477 RepID=A0ABP0DYV3_9PEZI
MAAPSTALIVTLALLVADGTIQLGFITSMVSYLHRGAPSGTFLVHTPPSLVDSTGASPTYLIKGKPLHVVINEGHTSNGAAGAAVVLMGIIGTLALFLRHRVPKNQAGRVLYYAWMSFQVPTLLLTIIALAYTFTAVHAHSSQTIDQALAYATQSGPYAADSWTPQNWFAAVLQLDLVDAALRSNLTMHLHIMRGWQYNLIALFLVQLLETVAAFADFRVWRARRGDRSSSSSSNSLNVLSTDKKYHPSAGFGNTSDSIQNKDSGPSVNKLGNYHEQFPQMPYPTLQQNQQRQHFDQV